MNKSLIKIVILFSLFAVAQSSQAKDWFGKHNRWGNFGNSDCNDWPEWTPMYWMEEMSGNNDNCYPGAYAAYGYGGYLNPYQSPYAYGAGAYGASNPYLANPYPVNPYASYAPRGLPPAYGLNPYAARAGIYPQNRASRLYGSRINKRSSPFGTGGLAGFPRFGGNNFTNPFSSFNGISNGINNGISSPFSSFGGVSPWSSYTSPMFSMSPTSPMGFGGMPGLSPMLPLGGGFGSPMSMGRMPGLSPLGGFGGNPFGGSSFMPFR